MVQREIERGYFKEVKPVNPVRDSNVIELNVSGDGDEFIDLSHTYLKTAVKIKKAGGGDLVADDKVSLINYIGATLFGKVDVLLNDTQVSSSTPNNAYRAMFESLLTYDQPCAESQMQAAGFYKDTAGQMDAVDPTPDGNAPTNLGLKERFELTRGSRTVEFISRIHADIFNQNRLMVNGVRCASSCTETKINFV